jgi:hypothetical protein
MVKFKRTKPAGLFLILCLFAVSIIAGSHIYAQDDGSGRDTKPPKDGPPPEGKPTPEEMAKEMSIILRDKIELTADQTTQVYDIVLNYAASHDRSNFDRKELDGKIEVVLNETQKEKFRDFIKNGKKLDHPRGPEEKKIGPNGEGLLNEEDMKDRIFFPAENSSTDPATQPTEQNQGNQEQVNDQREH